MPDLDALHFLRPAWLLTIIPAIVLWIVIHRRARVSEWRDVIAPHLL